MNLPCVSVLYFLKLCITDYKIRKLWITTSKFHIDLTGLYCSFMYLLFCLFYTTPTLMYIYCTVSTHKQQSDGFITDSQDFCYCRPLFHIPHSSNSSPRRTHIYPLSFQHPPLRNISLQFTGLALFS